LNIVVVTGTGLPFQRLVNSVENCAKQSLTWSFWVQHGEAALPAGMAGVPYLPRAELLERVRAADAVISHAGVGAVLDAVQAGRRPLVMPRLKRHGEHVNDHQLQLATALARDGLVRVVESAEEVAAALSGSHSSPKSQSSPSGLQLSVIEDVRELSRLRARRWMAAMASHIFPSPRQE